MIVDTSAVLAILLDEPERAEFTGRLSESRQTSMSAASFVEAAVVIDARGNPVLSALFDEFIDTAGVVVEPVSVEHARIARQAYRNYGRGSGHPAALNFGDCFSYALAKVRREPLLFKGDDFAKTDIARA